MSFRFDSSFSHTIFLSVLAFTVFAVLLVFPMPGYGQLPTIQDSPVVEIPLRMIKGCHSGSMRIFQVMAGSL